jgi:hypothetical protein
LVGWIINIGLPALLTQLGQWGGAFLGWIVPVIASLPGKLGDVIGIIVSWILSNGPTIGATMIGWAGQALGWLASLDLSIPGRLAGVFATIVSWIVQTGPKIATKMASFAVEGSKWVAALVTALPGKLGDMMGAIVKWVSDEGPRIATAFWSMAQNIGESFANGIAGLFVGAINVMVKAIDAIRFDVRLPSVTVPFVGTFGGQDFSWGGLGIGLLKVPTFDKGVLNIPRDTLAMVHKGEMVVPSAQAAALRGAWGAPRPGGETSTHHTHIYLDGREIADAVELQQGKRWLLAGSTGYRPAGG